ncbi:MAG: M3 family metallopeptidase, partial [Flavobacterium sp.]
MFTEKFNTPYTAAPFSQIRLEDYVPAFDQTIAQARAEVDAIINNPEAPTFENTLEALEFSGQALDRLSSIFFNLNSAETNDTLQQIAQEVSPKLTAFGNDIALNETLFRRVKAVYDQRDSLSLSPEQLMLLEKKYKGFSRNGALLSEDQKNRLREIDTELAKLKLTFGENVLAETNSYFKHITNVEDLAGLPEGAIEAAATLAQSKGLEGWVFTLDFPSYMPLITYADNRELRKEVAIAFGKKAFQDNNHNNTEILKRIVTLRHERAQLSAFAKERDGLEHLEKWDGAYYSEKLKQELFDLDDELLKPYFPLEKVLQGAFTVAEKLFGLTFHEIDTVDKYHPDVQTFEVRGESNDYVALFYADFFPRSGKRPGAWMTSFKSQYIQNGVNDRPHVSIVCNFTPPTPSKPSLLTFNEVTTLFHEFGHALHGMLANTTYPSLSGTSVYWDFVELPSQVMENWCYEPEALALFAHHYETGEVIPQTYVDKIKESASFLEGMATVRQLSFGLLDMAYHAQIPVIDDVKSFEVAALRETALYPDVLENCMSQS